ncbi:MULTISPECIES: gas vesicle protein GvpO [Streptomycetaceae]|uniref:gas vesicle protein GvpO n=1 Tax=Streptomycetaceae TaxID=2062 RepID=UPI0030087E34
MAETRARQSRAPSHRSGSRSGHPKDAHDAAERAAHLLGELIRRPTEGCSAVAPLEEGGWRVGVDVVEVARIPDTTSLLATYEVELAEDGALRSYRRVHRYRRGAVDE